MPEERAEPSRVASLGQILMKESSIEFLWVGLDDTISHLPKFKFKPSDFPFS